jgi:hypothetical protein
VPWQGQWHVENEPDKPDRPTDYTGDSTHQAEQYKAHIHRFYWFDEFDPQYLHLGRARGEFRRVEGTGGHVYLREFDDGWAVVNPTRSDVREIPVPGGGTAHILRHDNFRDAEQQPLVGQFELPAHRGVILLKPGRKAGNEDNG